MAGTCHGRGLPGLQSSLRHIPRRPGQDLCRQRLRGVVQHREFLSALSSTSLSLIGPLASMSSRSNVAARLDMLPRYLVIDRRVAAFERDNQQIVRRSRGARPGCRDRSTFEQSIEDEHHFLKFVPTVSSFFFLDLVRAVASPRSGLSALTMLGRDLVTADACALRRDSTRIRRSVRDQALDFRQRALLDVGQSCDTHDDVGAHALRAVFQ